MPTVTSVKQQKNKNRVNVYLDGKFGFGIDLDNFVLAGLKEGLELTEEEIAEVVKKAEFQKTWEKLLKFAMTRPRSEKEVLSWFKKKEVHESIWSELSKKLKHFDLLDDKIFAAWWVEQRSSFRPKSKRAIEAELFQKGISKETVSQILKDSPLNEEKIARNILKKKEYKWKNLDEMTARQKKMQYLAGKGFGWDVINNILKTQK